MEDTTTIRKYKYDKRQIYEDVIDEFKSIPLVEAVVVESKIISNGKDFVSNPIKIHVVINKNLDYIREVISLKSLQNSTDSNLGVFTEDDIKETNGLIRHHQRTRKLVEIIDNIQRERQIEEYMRETMKTDEEKVDKLIQVLTYINSKVEVCKDENVSGYTESDFGGYKISYGCVINKCGRIKIINHDGNETNFKQAL